MSGCSDLVSISFVLILPHVKGLSNTQDMFLILDPASTTPVFDLQDGQSYEFVGSNRFCYKNSIMPTWRQTWTRIQVSPCQWSYFYTEMDIDMKENAYNNNNTNNNK